MQIEIAKKYVVEVYSDKGPLEASPWQFIGEFNNATQATEACKQIVDDFLYKSSKEGLDAKSLVNQFLSYGDVPCINSEENFKLFDLYEYLNQKCLEITA